MIKKTSQNLPGEEVKHDTLLGELVRPAECGHILPTAVILALVGGDINETIVNVSAGKDRLQSLGALDLAELMGGAKIGGELG